MLDVFRSLENVPDVRPVLGRWYNVLDVLTNPLITTSVPVVIPVSEPVQVRDESPTISRFSGCTIRPPKKYDSDLIVVLDLDECLIHSEFFRDGDSSRTHQVQADPGEKQGVDGHVQSFNVSDVCKVNMRPHVAEFLEAVTGRYETYIFTAGTQKYADAVLDKLDPQGRLAGRLYRQHCVPQFGTYVKDLSILGMQRLHRTVLLDNSYKSFGPNPSNGIPIAQFFRRSAGPSSPTRARHFPQFRECS